MIFNQKSFIQLYTQTFNKQIIDLSDKNERKKIENIFLKLYSLNTVFIDLRVRYALVKIYRQHPEPLLMESFFPLYAQAIAATSIAEARDAFDKGLLN